MPFDVRPLGPGAAEIGPLDLAAPMDPQAVAAWRRAFAAHPVLVVRDQKLTAPQVAAAARALGSLETYAAAPLGATPATAALRETAARATPDQRLYPCPDDDCVLLMTNRLLDARMPLAVVDNAETWHADGAHKPQPYRAVALYVVENPAQGGETEFCDMRALCDALPGHVKTALIGRTAAHHWSKSRNPLFASALTPEAFAEGERVARLFPQMRHPVICEDAQDGRAHLFVSPRFTLHIEGLSPDLSRVLLDNLFALMEEPALVYRHVWREGDFVIWDNRRTNHRVRAYAAHDPRSRFRVTVSGEGPMSPLTSARAA